MEKLPTSQEMIRNYHNKLQKRLGEIYASLKELQELCIHPQVDKNTYSIIDDFIPVAIRRRKTQCTCIDCGKRWEDEA